MDPDLGIWISRDPKGEFWSPYTYVDNDPINSIDPDGRYRVRAVRSGKVWSDEQMSLVPDIQYQISTKTIESQANKFAGNFAFGRFLGMINKDLGPIKTLLGFGTKQVFSKEVRALNTINPLIENNIDKQVIQKFGDQIGANINPKNLSKDQLTDIIDATRDMDHGELVRPNEDIVNDALDKGAIGVKWIFC